MKLTKDSLFEAITKSIENARQLIEEGEILKNKRRYARAYTLFQLATEEVGKAMMTYGFLLFDDFENVGIQHKFLKNFKDHKIKIKKSVSIDFMIAKAIGSESIKKVILSNAETQMTLINKINDLKNNSLYTSLIVHKFLLPSEIITETMANDLGFYADIRQKTAKQVTKFGIKNFEKILAARKEMDMDKLSEESADYISTLLDK